VDVTPLRVKCRGPFPVVTNALLREFREFHKSFIYVTFVDENGSLCIENSRNEKWKLILTRIRSSLKHGIEVFGKRYAFVTFARDRRSIDAFSRSAWFLDEECELNVSEVVDWMRYDGDKEEMQRNVREYVEKMVSLVSDSVETIGLNEIEYEVIGDEMRMANECGEISVECATELSQRLKLRSVASAFKVKFNGMMGMLVQSTRDVVTRDKRVVFKQSQLKMKNQKDRRNMMEVCGVSKYRSCWMNRALVAILESLGVEAKAFVELQRKYVAKLMNIKREMKSDDVLELLRNDWMNGADQEWTSEMVKLIENGVSLEQETFLRDCVNEMVKHCLERLVSDAEIPIDNGAKLYAVVDPTGELLPGQVVIQLSKNRSDAVVVEGKVVVVSKELCLHPGDVRVLRAVQPQNENLKALKDVIVYSQTEECKIAARSELMTVIYETTLIPATMIEPMEVVRCGDRVRLDGDVDRMDVLSEYFVNVLCSRDLMRTLVDAHQVKADQNGGMSAECTRLAELAEMCAQGMVVELDAELKPTKYPDFMQRSDKESYVSMNALGRMYRDGVKAMEMFGNGCREAEDKQVVLAGEANGDVELEKDADVMCLWWSEEVSVLLEQLGVDSESKLVSGVGIPEACERKRMQLCVKMLRTRFREYFETECGKDEREEEKRMKKARAWYRAAKKDGMCRSFGWIMSDELCKIKQNDNKL